MLAINYNSNGTYPNTHTLSSDPSTRCTDPIRLLAQDLCTRPSQSALSSAFLKTPTKQIIYRLPRMASGSTRDTGSELHPDKYSYVDAALNAGYSILTYYRLGVGPSEKPDGYEIVQMSVKTEILKELAVLARSGTLSEKAPSIHVLSSDKVVLGGNSCGSGLTIAVLANYPHLADGAVSTGLIPNTQFGAAGQRAFGLVYAAISNPSRFGDRGRGYLVQGTESSLQQVFFKKGSFEPEMLKYANSIKETGAAGGLVSFPAALAMSAAGFMGPILFALAEYDMGTCLGDCKDTYNLTALKDGMFPGAGDVRVHLQLGSGHALTLNVNATGHYEAIFAYLREHGM
ncbi:hypothetical protein BDW75DRAFT_245936 [Aspergillus navahoensis]